MSNFVSSVDFQQAQQTIKELRSQKAALESRLGSLKVQFHHQVDVAIQNEISWKAANVALESQLAEARKDTERLDWLDKSGWALDCGLFLSGNVWCCYLDHQGITDRDPGKYRFTAKTAREAIDAAGALRAKPEATPDRS